MKKKIFALVSALVLVFGLGFFAKTENVYAANDTNKAQVEEKIKELKAAVRKNEIQAAAAKLLMEKNPKAVESFKDELIDLLNKSEALVKRAKKAIEIYEQMDDENKEEVESEDPEEMQDPELLHPEKHPDFVVDNKTVFEGKVKFFTTVQLCDYQNLDQVNYNYFTGLDIYKNAKFGVLLLDKDTTIIARTGDSRAVYDNGDTDMILLSYYYPENPYSKTKHDYVKQFDGKRVRVKGGAMWPTEAALPYLKPRIYTDMEIVEVFE
jgi:hypothetical protein